MGCEGRARGGPAPREQLRGPRLPREAGIWARAPTRPVASRRAGLRTDGDGARRGVPGQGIPPQGSQQSPLLIQPGQLWGCPTPVPAVPPMPGATGLRSRALPLTSPSLRHSQGWEPSPRCSASPAASAARVPGSLLPVHGYRRGLTCWTGVWVSLFPPRG